MDRIYNTLQLVVIFLLFNCLTANAKVFYKIDSDTLDYYYNDENYRCYFELLNQEKDTIIIKKNYIAFVDLEKYYLKDFNFSCDSIDSLFLRKQYMYLAHAFWSKFGNFDKAIVYYLRAHELAIDKLNLDEYAWYIENELGTCYTRKGNYDKAHYFYILAESGINCFGDNEQKVKLEINRGICFYSESKYIDAELQFINGYNKSIEINYLRGILANKLQLARIHTEREEFNKASEDLELCRKKIIQYKKDKDYLRKQSDLFNGLGYFFEKKGKIEEAISYYKKTIAVYQGQSTVDFRREITKLLISIARLYHLKNNEFEANKYVELGMHKLFVTLNKSEAPDSTMIYGENTISDLLYLKGQITYNLLGNKKDINSLLKILNYYELALYSVDLVRESFIGDNSQLISIKTNKEIINKSLDLYFEISALSDYKISYNKIQLLFDKSKSLLVKSKYKRNSKFLTLNENDKLSIIDIDNKMLDLGKKLYTTENKDRVLKERWELISIKNEILSSNTNKDINKNIDGNAIEYATSDSFVYSLSTIYGVKKYIKIGKSESVKNLVFKIRKYLDNKETNSMCLFEGFNLLLKPIENDIPKTITIITDGILGHIPFEILKGKNGKYLIEESTINYNYRNVQINSESNELNIYCLIPEYSHRSIAVSRSGLYELQYSKSEIKNLTTVFGNKSVSGENFISKAELLKKLKKYSIFHFAGHAISADSTSYLALGNDEKLFDYEISTNTLPLKLAVLNACSTGNGNYEYGEGIRSMGKSFLEAGTMSVIYSLWNINDESTSVLMNSFYKKTKKGFSISESLRNSKLDFIHSTSIEKRHPYFWAGLICIGGTEKITEPMSIQVILLLITFILSFFLFFTFYKKL